MEENQPTIGEISQEPIKPVENRREDGTFGPGNNANPTGRPKGKTIKECLKDYLEEHPEEKARFVKYFVKKNRELGWQMLEGKPKASFDMEVDAESLAQLTEFFRSLANKKDD